MAKRGGGRCRFHEAEPDVSASGIGKNYNGHRIFHARRTRLTEYIFSDGTTVIASKADSDKFRHDLSEAAKKDTKVADYLKLFPELRIGAAGEVSGFKPEPEPESKADALPAGTDGKPVTSSSSLSQEPSSRSPPNPADTS